MQGGNTQTTTNSYAWYDGAEKSSIVVSGTGAQANGTSTFTLDAFGRTTAMSMTGGATESRSYIYDAASQGIVNSDTINGTTYIDNWYRMGGTNMWHYSNRFDPRGGDADTSGASYTVRAGDTLQGIARIVWGDASLWYKIADANGLTASSGLTEGQSLRIPAGVWRNHLNADTYIPYNPASFVGPSDPSPLYASPAARGNKCGVFGQILLAAVAIAVSVVTYGALTGPTTGVLGTIGAGAAAGAAGSVASQGVGVATGIQDKFNFKAVAMAAIGGGVGGALNAGGAFKALGIGGNGFGALAAQGALQNAVTQGIGITTGLQSKFDWVGVAASAVGNAFGAKFGEAVGHNGGIFATNLGNDFAQTAASTFANAATRSALSGGNFGDNIIAALPDAIGGVIGRALGGAANAALHPDQQRAIDQASSRPTQGGDIIVNQKPLNVAGTIFDTDLSGISLGVAPETTITTKAISGAISSAETASALSRVKEIKQWLAASYAAEHTSGGGYQLLQDGGWAIDRGTLSMRQQDLERFAQANPGHADIARAKASLAVNGQLINRWDAIVNSEMNQIAFASIGGPALIAAGAVAAPGLLTFGLVNAGRITTASGIAGEIATGVPITVPVAGGAGIATIRAAEGAEGAYGSTFKSILSDIRAADFSTPKDGSVFWTGFKEGNQTRAMEWAAANGRSTIEMTPGGKWLNSLDLYGPNPIVSEAEADHLWRAASAQFARGAGGEVNAFTAGTRFDLSKTYYGLELRKLTANPSVTHPIIIR